jgi:outer membrane protein OmpA-like peptidoglycan-associated protein
LHIRTIFTAAASLAVLTAAGCASTQTTSAPPTTKPAAQAKADPLSTEAMRARIAAWSVKHRTGVVTEEESRSLHDDLVAYTQRHGGTISTHATSPEGTWTEAVARFLGADGAQLVYGGPGLSDSEAQAMLLAYAAWQPAPAIAEAEPEPEPVAVGADQLGRVLFATSSADIDSEGAMALDNVAELMSVHAEMKVEVRGHADQRGSEHANHSLSADRAAAVARYLMDAGVEADRLEVIPVGAVDGDLAAARRVDFAVVTQ